MALVVVAMEPDGPPIRLFFALDIGTLGMRGALAVYGLVEEPYFCRVSWTAERGRKLRVYALAALAVPGRTSGAATPTALLVWM